ncbi:MAG: hypothetical protein R3C01_07470 [Planctomycetaceae bacterium]
MMVTALSIIGLFILLLSIAFGVAVRSGGESRPGRQNPWLPIAIIGSILLVTAFFLLVGLFYARSRSVHIEPPRVVSSNRQELGAEALQVPEFRIPATVELNNDLAGIAVPSQEPEPVMVGNVSVADAAAAVPLEHDSSKLSHFDVERGFEHADAAPAPAETSAMPRPVLQTSTLRGWFVVFLLLGCVAVAVWMGKKRNVAAALVFGLAFPIMLALLTLLVGYADHSQRLQEATIADSEAIRLRLEQEMLAIAKAEASIEPETPAVAEDANDREMTEYTSLSGPASRLTKTPAWVNSETPGSFLKDSETFVLRSGWFATVQEAEEKVLSLLEPKVQEFLARRVTSVNLPKTPVDFALVRRTNMITRRLHERSVLETTSHREPIYQVTWQVTLDADVQMAMLEGVLPDVRKTRLLQAGLLFGLLTLLFGTWGAYFRMNDAMSGRYQVPLRLAATGVTVLAASVLLMG